jgi:hypothetical protein
MIMSMGMGTDTDIDKPPLIISYHMPWHEIINISVTVVAVAITTIPMQYVEYVKQQLKQ